MWMAKFPHHDFAERFKYILEHSPLAGVQKKEIAKRLEISAPMVTLLTKGERLPAMDLACRIAVVTGYCVEYVLTGRGPKHPGLPDDDGIDEPPWRDLPQDARHHFAEALRAIADARGQYEESIKKPHQS